MTKSKKRLIILGILLLLAAAVLFYMFVWNKPKVKADVNTKVFNSAMCQKVGDDYYFISGKNVKCLSGGEEKTVYEGTKPYRICADKEYLYVCDNGIICVDLKSGKSRTILNVKKESLWYINADNGFLFYEISSEPLKCLDIKTGETKDAIELLNDKSDGFHKQRFSDDKWIIADIRESEIYSFEIAKNDMSRLFARSHYNSTAGFVEKDNELLKVEVSGDCFDFDYIKSDRTEVKSVDLPQEMRQTGETTIKGNDAFAVIVAIDQPFSMKGDHHYLPELEYHYHDTYVKVNTADFKVQRHKTKKFERIIYADDNKVMTYYNGKYLTYSADDWKVTDEKKADEIKNDGKYTFEACGEYVFVFDDDTGECINRVEI